MLYEPRPSANVGRRQLTSRALDGARQVRCTRRDDGCAYGSPSMGRINRVCATGCRAASSLYVHVPNTGRVARSFNRSYFAQSTKRAAICMSVIRRWFSGDYDNQRAPARFRRYFRNVAAMRYPFTRRSAGCGGCWGPRKWMIIKKWRLPRRLMPLYVRLEDVIRPLVGRRRIGRLVHTADSPALIDCGTCIAPRGGFFFTRGAEQWSMEAKAPRPYVAGRTGSGQTSSRTRSATGIRADG